MSPAGQWAGWSEDDMRTMVLPRLRRSRVPRRSLLATLLLGRHLSREWAKVDPARS